MKKEKINVAELFQNSKKNEAATNLRSASEMLEQMRKQPIVLLSDILFQIVQSSEDKNSNPKQ